MRSSILVLIPLLAAVGSCSSDQGATTRDTGAATVESDSIPPSTPGPDTVDTSSSTNETSDTEQTETPEGGGVPTTGMPLSTDPEASARPPVINGPGRVVDAEHSDGGDTSPDDPGSDCSSVPRGLTEMVVDGGGVLHDVRIHVPERLESEPAPVVLDWHGLGSNGADQAAYSGYEDLAQLEGFIAVHPTGAPGAPGGPNSWELAQFDTPGRDDLAFVDVLIDRLVDEWCGDPERIYSTGMSNGGFFTAELVCNRADRIAAAVSVAGLGHPDSCAPSRPVPYLAFHGTDDDVVPFDGDGRSLLGSGEDDPLSVFFTQVIPEEFGEFAADAGCDPEPTQVEETPEVIRFDYTGCVDGTPLMFYELPGSGHTWPGSPLADVLGEGAGHHTSDVSATVDGWEFLEQFSL